MAVANQQSFRGAGTAFYILITVIMCYLPAIVTWFVETSADTLTDTNKIEILALIKPWTSTFHIMYSAISPFVYVFRCKRLRKYSRKLLTKPLRLMSENFSKLIHFHL